MKPARIVILGGGYSGVIAARRLAYKTRGQPTQITLVNGSDEFVQRIRLHQVAANQTLPALPMRKMLAGTRTNFVKGWVSHLDPNARSLTVKTAVGSETLNYDYLIYALGSFVDTGRVPGAAEFALSVSSYETTLKLRARLPEVAAQAGRLVVCGGGLTGIETATEFAERYPTLKVSLVTREAFGAQLSESGQTHLRKAFDRLGIQVIDNVNITRISPTKVEYNGGTVDFDLCLWAGSFAVSPLAGESGLTVNARGQIVVDDHLRSLSHPEVYAVGDAADVTEAIGTPIRMGCATAVPMGSYAADDLAARLRGKPQRPYEFSYAFRCISLGRHDALIQMVDANDNPKEKVITGWLGSQFKEMICRAALWQIRHASLMLLTSPREHAERHASSKAIANPAHGR